MVGELDPMTVEPTAFDDGEAIEMSYVVTGVPSVCAEQVGGK